MCVMYTTIRTAIAILKVRSDDFLLRSDAGFGVIIFVVASLLFWINTASFSARENHLILRRCAAIHSFEYDMPHSGLKQEHGSSPDFVCKYVQIFWNLSKWDILAIAIIDKNKIIS